MIKDLHWMVGDFGMTVAEKERLQTSCFPNLSQTEYVPARGSSIGTCAAPSVSPFGHRCIGTSGERNAEPSGPSTPKENVPESPAVPFAQKARFVVDLCGNDGTPRESSVTISMTDLILRPGFDKPTAFAKSACLSITISFGLS
jgi:hypothetical protein